MALKEPESMEDLVYHTNRYIGEKGQVRCWVERQKCTKCGKGLMGKPTGSNGKVKVRAKEYACPECGYTVESREYEEGLTASIKYTCPKCEYSGEIQVPFKRKKVKVFDDETKKTASAEALVFECQKCREKINITKKKK